MGIYDITGWSGGGRRPINYGLKAGQFRGMGRVNVFPSSTTIVNNNIIGGGGYYSTVMTAAVITAEAINS